MPTAAKDLNFFNKTNQAQLRMLLRPGAAFGVTDIVLGITEPKSQDLQFFVDNEGTRSTARPAVLDLLPQIRRTGARRHLLDLCIGIRRAPPPGTMRYDIPISPWGTRLSLGYTKSSTKVVDGADSRSRYWRQGAIGDDQRFATLVH